MGGKSLNRTRIVCFWWMYATLCRDCVV